MEGTLPNVPSSHHQSSPRQEILVNCSQMLAKYGRQRYLHELLERDHENYDARIESGTEFDEFDGCVFDEQQRVHQSTRVRESIAWLLCFSSHASLCCQVVSRHSTDCRAKVGELFGT